MSQAYYQYTNYLSTRLVMGSPAELGAGEITRRGEPVDLVLLRSRSGVLGTIEVGNVYPRRTREGEQTGQSRDKLLDGADGEFKIVGRDALLMAKDGAMRLVTTDGDETLPGTPQEMPSYRLLADALEHWRRGEPPPVSAEDCYRAVRLVDEAYRVAKQAMPP
jgi:hypothetical protein